MLPARRCFCTSTPFISYFHTTAFAIVCATGTIPVIKVNWNTFQTAEDMAKMIKKEYLRMQNITSVSFNQPWPKPAGMESMVLKHHEPAEEDDLGTTGSALNDSGSSAGMEVPQFVE